MELTKSKQILMDGLQTLNFSTETIVMLMMCCQTEETARQLVEYMIQLTDNKEKITEQKLLNKIVQMNQ